MVGRTLAILALCGGLLAPSATIAQTGSVQDFLQTVDNSKWNIYVYNGTNQTIRITDFQISGCENVSSICGYLYAGYVARARRRALSPHNHQGSALPRRRAR